MDAPQPNLRGWGTGSPALGCVRDSGGGTRAASSVLPDENFSKNRSKADRPKKVAEGKEEVP